LVKERGLSMNEGEVVGGRITLKAACSTLLSIRDWNCLKAEETQYTLQWKAWG
jgi:hypothetical protein